MRFTRTKLLALAFLVACSGGGNAAMEVPPHSQVPTVKRELPAVSHIVLIVQENRSFDNLFQGFPGANTQNYGLNSTGQQVPLAPASLAEKYDIDHSHATFEAEYASGNLNGWNLAPIVCIKGIGQTQCPPADTPFAYTPQADAQPYWDLATQYTLADAMFQTNEGPSFAAHQYIISGTSTNYNGSSLRAAENPSDPNQGGCDSTSNVTVALINTSGKESQKVYPCFTRTSIFDELDKAGLTWKYYQAHGGAGIWNGVDAVKQIWGSPEYKTNVVWPPSQILTDISDGTLAAFSVVTPTALASDHALMTDGSGPSWVASVVNAIGTSPYWNNTVIFVTWDDWGGWYDHLAPQQFNSYELGFRVPLLVISPYAKVGYVSHTQHEFGSILKFTEEAFGLPSMGTTDARSDDLSDCFSIAASRRFHRIKTKFSAAYFLHQPLSAKIPDND
jgi:phospholipase C